MMIWGPSEAWPLVMPPSLAVTAVTSVTVIATVTLTVDSSVVPLVPRSPGRKRPLLVTTRHSASYTLQCATHLTTHHAHRDTLHPLHPLQRVAHTLQVGIELFAKHAAPFFEWLAAEDDDDDDDEKKEVELN